MHLIQFKNPLSINEATPWLTTALLLCLSLHQSAITAFLDKHNDSPSPDCTGSWAHPMKSGSGRRGATLTSPRGYLSIWPHISRNPHWRFWTCLLLNDSIFSYLKYVIASYFTEKAEPSAVSCLDDCQPHKLDWPAFTLCFLLINPLTSSASLPSPSFHSWIPPTSLCLSLYPWLASASSLFFPSQMKFSVKQLIRCSCFLGANSLLTTCRLQPGFHTGLQVSRSSNVTLMSSISLNPTENFMPATHFSM